MALKVSTIFNFSETPFKLSLLAGKSGLSKIVSWIYYTEDSSTISFIRGGELVITTGLNLERHKQNNVNIEETVASFLKEMIDEFLVHNASGLIINVGKYINEIPQSIIDYCDEQAFALFSMPWEIHTVDLMQSIGNMISADNQNCHSTEKFFHQAIFEKEKFDPDRLENTTFHNAKNFSVALMEIKEELFNGDIEQIKRYVRFSFNPKINVLQTQYASFIYNHKVIYVIRDDNSIFINELFLAARRDRYFKSCKISVSNTCSSILNLEECYNHAKISMDLNTDSEKISCYDNLGIYKILLDVKDKKVLEQFYMDTLGSIEQLENGKKEDFLKTLQLYLKLGGNIHSVSEQNNTHRNTVLYRIQRLEDMLGMNLSDGDSRCLLQIALYIRKIIF
jgi:hypothetical protein